MLLEVIACSVEDAVEAERGGAGRLESSASWVRLQRLAAMRVGIPPGGGVDLKALWVVPHVTDGGHVGRAARVPPTVGGAVSAEKGAALVETARG